MKMARLISTFLAITNLCFAETYVEANRADLKLERPEYALPFDIYTNTTLWLAGGAVSNNASSAIDWSPNKANALYVGGNACDFAGDNDYVDITTAWTPIKTNGTTGSFGCWVNADTNINQTLVSVRDVLGNAHRFELSLVGNRPQITVFSNSTTLVALRDNAVLSTGVWHYVEAAQDGVSCELYVDFVKVTSFISEIRTVPTAWWDDCAVTHAVIGKVAKQSSGYFDGQLCGVNFKDGAGNYLALFPMAEGLGAGTTVYDVIAGRNGTATDVTLATFRAGTAKDGCANNLANGCVTWTNDSTGAVAYVPMRYGTDTPIATNVTGCTLELARPRGAIHNGAEAGIVFNGITNYFLQCTTNTAYNITTNASGFPVELYY